MKFIWKEKNKYLLVVVVGPTTLNKREEIQSFEVKMHTASGRDYRLCDSGEVENSQFVLSGLQLRLVLLKKKKGAKLIENWGGYFL